MLMANKSTFHVGDVPVHGDVVLAPMAGYSDVPYRALCRAFGSAMHYTEFVPVEPLLGRPGPIWQRLDKKPGEYPMVFQIFGNDADKILRAAQRIEPLGPDIIDINMGCSTRKVSGRGAGVGMMPNLDLIATTFRLLTQHLSVPVTGKIRLGWQARINYLEVAQVMEENGAALIAMHGRTKEQKYGGQADWDALAELKQAVHVPVIGSGDVTTPGDIERMLAHTGVDAVMVGRGAIGNPWIFARRRRAELAFDEIAATIRLHLREMLDYYGRPDGLVRFRKHFKQYVAGWPAAEHFLPAMLTATEPACFLAQLAEMETAVLAATGVHQQPAPLT